MWDNKQKHRRQHVHIFVTLKKNKKKRNITRTNQSNLSFRLLLLYVFLVRTRNRSWLLQNIVASGQHICVSQPAFHSAECMPLCAHHNHMMLQLIPSIMTTSSYISHLIFFSSSYFPFFISLFDAFNFFLTSAQLWATVSLFSHSIISWRTFGYFQRSLRSLSFSFFSSPPLFPQARSCQLVRL